MSLITVNWWLSSKL